MSVDQVDVARLGEIVGNVKVATGDVMQVKVKKVVHQANLLRLSEAGLAVAAAFLLHREDMCANIATICRLFDRQQLGVCSDETYSWESQGLMEPVDIVQL